jgi:hypothetical protein
MTDKNVASFPPPPKTQKQVEAIGDALSDVMKNLIKNGQQEIHVLETMLGIAVAGAAHYGGDREMAMLFRQLAEQCDRWADEAEKKQAATH